MADRKNPFIELGFPEYAGAHMMPFGMQERAATHEVARQRVVSSIFLELHLMALVKIIEENAKISMAGAYFQSLEGTEAQQTEAAHCAPRQILIGSKPADMVFKNSEDGLRLKFLFGETDVLPVNFNKSDSRAERNGLAEGFFKGCEYVITAAHNGGEFKNYSIVTHAATAYSIYESFAQTAFNQSILRLKEKLKGSGITHREKINWTEQLIITQKYMESLAIAEGKAYGLAIAKIEGLIKVYELISKEG